MERAEFITTEHLEYLDHLRESGETNMFGAGPYLQRDFPKLSKSEVNMMYDNGYLKNVLKLHGLLK